MRDGCLRGQTSRARTGPGSERTTGARPEPDARKGRVVRSAQRNRDLMCAKLTVRVGVVLPAPGPATRERMSEKALSLSPRPRPTGEPLSENSQATSQELEPSQ